MSQEKDNSVADDTEDQLPQTILPIDEHVEEVAENGRKVRRKGVYLLPNLFTTTALFCGFYAIVSSMNQMFEQAAIAIFVAMIFDGLDGRVARLTNTQSAFGAEYDSLSDMVAFGAAPALVCFNWNLTSLGKVGWMVAFIYVACVALRLARFNTQIDTADKRYFTGLPCPSAAAVVAAMVWALNQADLASNGLVTMFTAAVMALTGILMVSNVRYHSFKDLEFKGRVPFVAIIAIVLVFAVVFTNPPWVLMVVFLLYAASGPVLAVWRFKQKRVAAAQGK
ncbi:CDP-diacylglycerol--serine O-phosphatidyltransferase [Spartinivicinus poritis]|uniref:CDP-diacylglycerol--serine O-phosphatidyltransferase n=1 Tax=Spartinivicinus poritis TaxID=2994640 RepID=A0ABT5U9Z9_9GAMM|nr:CDP-diacylglycerol--serine O-phosphatidyltransferase [Spartinivicinus sp. A2-2]MDE1463188.1 CDP-diacylglycerol--serine O-phosphatidyltransferase [Spartinivicinus sp. A2-2]